MFKYAVWLIGWNVVCLLVQTGSKKNRAKTQGSNKKWWNFQIGKRIIDQLNSVNRLIISLFVLHSFFNKFIPFTILSIAHLSIGLLSFVNNWLEFCNSICHPVADYDVDCVERTVLADDGLQPSPNTRVLFFFLKKENQHIEREEEKAINM